MQCRYTQSSIHPDRGFSGGVTVGAHAGWSRLQTFGFLAGLCDDQAAARRPPRGRAALLHDILLTKTTGTPGSQGLCPGWRLGPREAVRITGEAEDPTAQIDFTRADGRGGEATEQNTTYCVVMEREYTNPRSGARSAAAERYRLRYRKMTYSNMPPSSADVSHIVKGALMRAG